MEKSIVRQFVIDGDICEVVFRFNKDADKYIGDYPDFYVGKCNSGRMQRGGA